MIYLDANATAALRPSAQRAILAGYGGGEFVGNPSSVHAAGRTARRLLTEARRKLSLFLSQGKNEHLRIIFTSGGTESACLMLHGFLSPAPNHLVSSSIEHAAVREPLKNLEAQGIKICWVPPASDGRVAASDIFNSVSPQTELVTLMGANNESGALQPIAELGSLLRTSGYAGAFVSDFTQVIGKQPCDVPALFDSGLDALSLSGHKIGAPPGVGALVFSSNPSLCRTIRPLLPGGGQEEGLRGGTENLPAIVALGEVALELLSTGEAESKKSRELRDRLWQSLSQHLPHLRRLTPEGEGALPNTLLIHTPGCRGDDLVVALDLRGVCASMGAACSSGKQQISHVATAMGLAPKEAREILRLSIDWNTSLEGVDEAARHIIEVITHIQQVQMHP